MIKTSIPLLSFFLAIYACAALVPLATSTEPQEAPPATGQEAALPTAGRTEASPDTPTVESTPLVVPATPTPYAWVFSMKIRPFDLLFPDTTADEIQQNLDRVVSEGANTVILYIEEEQMYRTFVDESGFAAILDKIAYLVEQAHARGLKVICYLNALEVMAHNAAGDPSIPTLYRSHPDWMQIDIYGQPMAWTGVQNDWITADMEDAWASPYSGFRDLFKRRLTALGQQGLDAVYLDQASLPGLQDEADNWASSDPGFSAAFQARYGLAVPSQPDWDSVAWRKFIYFRHEAVQDYLRDLAQTAQAGGMEAFFESSANDTLEGTRLGNDPALSVMGGIYHSPEIEPEGDYLAAFRMAMFARDIRLEQPILYLGWGEAESQARRELAIAISFSGNYYATSEARYPPQAFEFMDTLRPILDQRAPYAEIGLVYSVRNKDWSYESQSAFNAYAEVFEMLVQSHLPFRIIPLETLTAETLNHLGPLVLPQLASLSDAEFVLLKEHPVVLLGENATRNEWGEPRLTPLQFPNIISLDALETDLPFTLTAPDDALIAYYTDQTDPKRFYLFIFSLLKRGQVSIDVSLPITVYELDHAPRTVTGDAAIRIQINDYLTVLDLGGR